jgi:hypothetical protein
MTGWCAGRFNSGQRHSIKHRKEDDMNKTEGGTRPIKVINIMKDGTVLKSLEGVKLPEGHPVYGMLRRWAEKQAQANS